jgi:hypothetical protein
VTARQCIAWLTVAWALMLRAGVTFAKVETLPIACAEERICLWDRPVLSPPDDWELQQEASNTSHVSMYGPPTAYGDATAAFMVARAVRRTPEQTTEQFIESELDYVLARQLDLHAHPSPPMQRTADQEWPVFRIASSRENEPVESVVFGQDGAFFVVFVLSTRNLTLHDALWPKFNAWVTRYRAAEHTR